MATTNFPAGITSFGNIIMASGGAQFSPFGATWFVDTVNGNDANPTNEDGGGTGDPAGNSPLAPFATMGRVMEFVGSNDVIYFAGTIREQITAPLGVYGVRIIGAQGGGVRDDNGAKWTYPASGATAGGALLLLREQGWSLSNFLMTPEPTSGACVELRRAEDATYPDASHAIFTGMRFVGIDVTTTYGIRDIGGCSNIQVQDCEFYLCTTGYYCSSTAIAVPLRNKFYGNRFLQNTNDIIAPMSYGLFQGNRHYSTAATEKVEISGGGYNIVTGNVFPDAIADIDPAHGYDGNATDTWTGNLVSDQAAFQYGDPA
jgi:hypothetical protein